MSDSFPPDWDRAPSDFPGPEPTSFPARDRRPPAAGPARPEPSRYPPSRPEPQPGYGPPSQPGYGPQPPHPPDEPGYGPQPGYEAASHPLAEPGYAPPPYPQGQGAAYPSQGPPGGSPPTYPPQPHAPGRGYEPPYQPTPPGPPPKVRTRPMIWPWLLGALLFVMLGVGGCVVFVARLAQAPVAATNGFVAALDENRLDDAYATLCADTRAAVSQADFEADHSAVSGITGYTFASLTAGTGQATTVSGTIEVDDVPRSVTYTLRQESGGWKICSYLPIT